MIKKILLFFILIFIIAGFVGYKGHQIVYGPNVSNADNIAFYIRPGDKPSDIISQLKSSQLIVRHQYLGLIADKMSFIQASPKIGRYLFEDHMSIYDVLNKLRLGEQDAVALTLQNLRFIDDLAGLLGQKLMNDSIHYFQILNQGGDQSLCNYLPDTYRFNWSTSAEEFVQRMTQYSAHFWKDKSTTILGREFTRCEIYTLASIVEKETAYNLERPKIASVYINRLLNGMRLQADPTVVYSANDFSLRRVLYKHLAIESPYNTYLNDGLPPGPICMPSKASIMAVLNASASDFLYFCAMPNNSGTHAFAETLAQHNRNARAFQRWMNQRGIR